MASCSKTKRRVVGYVFDVRVHQHLVAVDIPQRVSHRVEHSRWFWQSGLILCTKGSPEEQKKKRKREREVHFLLAGPTLSYYMPSIRVDPCVNVHAPGSMPVPGCP